MSSPLDHLIRFVSCPSISADPQYLQGMEQARKFLCGLFETMGLETEQVRTPLHPIILARHRGSPDWPHVLIYGHYDVQPADPLDLWTSPPFSPTVRHGRLYGRGAADNKGPLLAHVSAFADLLSAHPDLPLNVTFLVEGEEEIGSPSFAGFLHEKAADLRADFVLLSDTGSPSPEQMAITTGLRGIVALEVELGNARVDLHSGVHGGVLLNPIQALAELCASLHLPDGTINIPGFYNGITPVPSWEREEVRRLATTEDAYRSFLGIEKFHLPSGYTPFEATRFLPTLEFNGIGGGYQGEGSKTVIPARAFAKISCRLVPGQDPALVVQRIKEALQDRCPAGLKLKVRSGHHGHPYVIVPPDRPNTPPDQNPALAEAFRACHSRVLALSGNPPLYLREGGSVPIISALKTVLGLDSLMLGLFLPEDNLHAPDESFSLEMLERGKAISHGILSALARI